MKKIKLLSLLLCLVLTVGTMTSCLLLGDNGMTLEDVETLLNQRLDGNITVEGGDSYNVEINTSLPSEQLAAGKALLSVVSVYSKFETRLSTGISAGGAKRQYSSAGAGVIYQLDKDRGDAYIITNYHVVYDYRSDTQNKVSDDINVYLYGQENADYAIPATYIGGSMNYDLAVLKVEKTGLPAIEMADSDSVKVGQYAIAIGCPGGIEFLGSVSYGIVSGLNRSITIDSIGEMELIQTDAAINPGNSGGALLNSSGQLIGINSSKLIDESFEGMGFAIPSNTVVEVVEDIIDNKDNPSPYIGIEIYTYSSSYLNKYGLPAGAAVKSVVDNGPADQANIRSGDIITEFASVTINEYDEFIDALNNCTPGTKVTAKIYRNGRYYTTTVTIGSNNSR